MPTDAFWKDREYYEKRNKFYTYEQKEEIWQYIVKDWRDGLPPHPYIPSCDQMIEFHKSPAQFRTVSTGHRAGKTVGCVADVIPMIVDPAGDVRGWILANTYSLAKNEWGFFEEFITKTPLLEKCIIPRLEEQLEKRGRKSDPHRLIRFTNTPTPTFQILWPCSPPSLVELKSFKDQSKWIGLEGVCLSFLIVAEGTTFPHMLWDKHIGMRTSDRGAPVIFPATPKNMGGFMHEIFQLGLGRKLVVEIDMSARTIKWHDEDVRKAPEHIDNATEYLDSYQSWQFPAHFAAHYNKRKYEADKRKLFDGKLQKSFFVQNHFGVYTSHTGKFFEGVSDDIFIQSEDHRINPRSTFFRAIDIGSASPSCCLWIAVEPPNEEGVEKWIVFRELYKAGMWVGNKGEENFKDTLAGMILSMTYEQIEWSVVDRRSAHYRSANSKHTIEEMLYDAGVPCVTLGKHIKPRETVDAFAVMKREMLSRRILIYEDKCPGLMKEKELLEYKEKTIKEGKEIQKDEFADSPMHALDALCDFCFMNPIWIKPSEEIEREKKALLPQKESYQVYLDLELKARSSRHFAGIGHH